MATITGINHMVMVCKDMDVTHNFYVNVLGMKLKATGQESVALAKHAFKPAHPVKRIYFFEMGDGSCITFVELPTRGEPDAPLFTPNYWPGASAPPKLPSKVDHVAFNVNSRDDLAWFHRRLKEHGVGVSEIYERDATPKFVKSIYFFDPDGNAVEIATWDRADPSWEEHKSDNYFRDPDPVPSSRR